MPNRTIWHFSNNKPWINLDINVFLKENKSTFGSGNNKELRAVLKDQGNHRGEE